MGDDTPSPSIPTKIDPALAEVMSLFKEMSLALIENSKATRALLAVYASGKNADGDEETGLLDQLAELQGSIDSLDEHVVGQNLMLARQNFVDDKLLEIWKGNPTATPPVEGREPTLADRAAALADWEARLEKEAEEDDTPQPSDDPELPEDEPQPSPMLTNSSRQWPPKKLPPPPVMKS